MAAKTLGVEPVVFANLEDRAEAVTDAAEALLTLTNSHRKVLRPRRGYTVVDLGLGGRILRMEHFEIIEDELGID